MTKKQKKYLIFAGIGASAYLVFTGMKHVQAPQSFKDYRKRISENGVLSALKIYAPKFGISLKLAKAMCYVESRGRTDVGIGQAGEIGILQVTKGALHDFNRYYGDDMDFTELSDTKLNAKVAFGYLALRAKHFDTPVSNFKRLAITYNGGNPKNAAAEKYYWPLISKALRFV